jgi:predicted Mrr-cat superfamily restriction endonuclease
VKTKQWKTAKNIQSTSWPANSPDLNPIENLWKILKERVAKRYPRNKSEIVEAAMGEWEKFRDDPELLHSIVGSMPARIEACIANNGGHTKY